MLFCTKMPDIEIMAVAVDHSIYGNSHPDMFSKKGVLKIFCRIYSKVPLLESPF